MCHIKGAVGDSVERQSIVKSSNANVLALCMIGVQTKNYRNNY